MMMMMMTSEGLIWLTLVLRHIERKLLYAKFIHISSFFQATLFSKD